MTVKVQFLEDGPTFEEVLGRIIDRKIEKETGIEFGKSKYDVDNSRRR